MKSSAYQSFHFTYQYLIDQISDLSNGIPVEIARLAASGIYIQCVSRFEVFFEDAISEYCKTRIMEISPRQQASIFCYLFKKDIFEKLTCFGNEKDFIAGLEKEILRKKTWLNVQSIAEVNSIRLIGRKDYPKPENIKLALFKLGLEDNLTQNLSKGLSSSFEDELKRILDVRNTIAHDGIPSEWKIEETKIDLIRLNTIAENFDNHLFP